MMKLFLECDLSQIESRIVGALSLDPELIRLARTLPDEFDVHKHNASIIFQVSEDQVTAGQRYLGKRVVHACLTPEHEVLTPWGWRSIAQMQGGDIVAQWNEGKVTFATVSSVCVYEAPSEMLSLQNRGISQIVTRDHRIPFVTNGNLKVLPAADLPKGAKVPVTGMYSGWKIPKIPPEFLVATQADGKVDGRRVVFHFVKERKVHRLLEILKRYEIPFEHKIWKKHHYINTHPKQRPIKEFGPYLLSWRGEALDQFLGELPFWGGTKRGQNGQTSYCTSESQNAVWVQTVAHLRGREALYRKAKGPAVRVSFNARKFAYPKIQSFASAGVVYGLTVSSGFFFVRHRNIISVTGNTNYGMGPKRLAEILLNDDYMRELRPGGIPISDCARLIQAYLRAMPAIEAWQQRTRLYLLEQKRDTGTMKLKTSWGREIDYTYERPDKEGRLWKRAYAFIPQSEDGDLMNQWGVLALWKYLEARPLEGVAMNIQEHDAIILSTPVEHAYEVASFLQDSLTRPRKYKLEASHEGVKLSIPVEFSLSLDWGKQHRVGFKCLPTKEEFERQAEELLRESL